MTRLRDPTGTSDFTVFLRRRDLRGIAVQRFARRIAPQDTREEPTTERKRGGRRTVRRRERRKILRVSPTRGRWSTEPPPRTVCHPPDGFGACARRALVSSRLGLFQPVDQPVRLSRADGFLRLPESIGSIVASLLSTDQSAIGVYLIRCTAARLPTSDIRSMSRGRDRMRNDTASLVYTASRLR